MALPLSIDALPCVQRFVSLWDKSRIMDNKERSADVAPPDEPACGPANLPAREAGVGRKLLWRMAFWACTAIASLTVAFLVLESSDSAGRRQQAADAVIQEAHAIAQSIRDDRNEMRRLAAAVATLNHDRDRLFARVATLERSPDSIGVTGAIPKVDNTIDRAEPASAGGPPSARTAASKRLPPQATNKQPAAPEPPVAAIAGAAADPWTAATTRSSTAPHPAIALHHTEFGVDLGTGASPAALRRLWAAAARAHAAELAPLRPVIVVREDASGHIRFHLVAGPLRDAATAARLCVAMGNARRSCEPTVFEGQRLTLEGGTVAEAPVRMPKPRPRIQAQPAAAPSTSQSLPLAVRP